MPEREKDGFFKNVDKFFKRVQNQDLVKLGDNKITSLNAPASKEEINRRAEFSVFRQYLQQKNWSTRHRELFGEYRKMDESFPIINAALRLYCHSLDDTSVTLLSGVTKTLRQLIDENAKDFYVWSYDPTLKKIVPAKAEKVVSTGFKKVLKLTLDDGTIIKCTPDHKHLLKTGEWVEMQDLKAGDSLRSIYERKNENGYLELADGEVLKNNKKKLKWKKAHSIVANEVELLKEQKINLPKGTFESKKYNTPVCHHKSFNKLNNNPNELEWMLWGEHETLHQIGYNQTLRWENMGEEQKQKRLEKIRQDRKDFWANPEKAEKRSKEHSENMKAFYASMTKEERSKRHKELQPFDENHNWWGRDTHGKNNPHADLTKKHFEDFTIEELDAEVVKHNSIKSFCQALNCTKATAFKYRKFKNHSSFTISRKINHKVVSIEDENETIEVGDIVNAGKHHNFAIRCNEGMVITHNSQEVCLSGDTVIRTPAGNFSIRDLYNDNKDKNPFYVQSYNKHFNHTEWCMARYIKSNGIKKVFEVTVERNIDANTAATDSIQVASFKCTGNHKIMLNARGDFKEVNELKAGDTIFGLYKWIDPSCRCKRDTFTTTKILSIQDAGEEEVFDLVDVSPSHHFSIKLTDSFYVEVHNCTKDTQGNVIKIVTNNKEVQLALEECFFDNLKLNSQSYLLAKEMMKFGNLYCFLNTRRGVGVTDLIFLPPEAIRIQLLPDAETLDAFRYDWMGGGSGMHFEPWELVHWRNIEDIEMQPYGTSILRSIVDTWRRIVLMREALIIYRITRAPQRYLFKIDTTNMDPDAALRYAEEMKKSLYKKPLVNPTTGEIDFKYNPISIEENYYMPTTSDDVGGIEMLEGASNLDSVEDYKIIKDDLFAGLLIPKSFLTFEEDLSNKAALCLRENSKLLTNEGVKQISHLAEEFSKDPDKKIFALSCNKYGIVSSGKIMWCKATKKVTELYRIHINSTTYIDCTNNHPFLMEDLSYIKAEDLLTGLKLKGIYEGLEFIVSNIEVVKLDEEEFVYDLGVEDYHNFALEAGIFVHNSQEDLRFSGAIKQYQSYFIEGLLHIALVHLHIMGFSKEDLESFSIEMNTNSTLAEKTRNELLQQRIDLAKSALDDSNGMAVMSFTQVLKDILQFTDDEISRTFKNQLIEKKIMWRLNELKTNGFYEEPKQEKQRAIMQGLNADQDIFSSLTFESLELGVKGILTEKLEKELSHLLRPVSIKATKKIVENIVSTTLHAKNTKEFIEKSKKVLKNLQELDKNSL